VDGRRSFTNVRLRTDCVRHSAEQERQQSKKEEEAATIAIETVKNYLATHILPSQIIFACFDEENYNIYRRLLND